MSASSSSKGKCRTVNNLPGNNGVDGQKSFYAKNCEASLLRRYETQPWFKNRVVQAEWKAFVDELVTPTNIGPQLCPGPDDWEFKCHKARALIGPTVPCTWLLPEQDKCAGRQYGINRDWHRYNEDERMKASDIKCGCNDAPVCSPTKSKRTKGLGYTGKKFGARYASWGNGTLPFPHPPVYNYKSLSKCY